MRTLKHLILVGLVSAAASAGVITDASFEAAGLPAWSPTATGTAGVPFRDNSSGVVPTNGSFYASFDSPINTAGSNDLKLTQSGVQWALQTSTLTFELLAPQNTTPPTNKQIGARIDNVRFTGSGTGEHLLFDFLAFTKSDPVDRDPASFLVKFGGTTLYTFNYVTGSDTAGNTSLLNTRDGAQGYSYGTDWHTVDLGPVTIQSVPEPASCLLLGLGLLPVVRRRRRRAA